MKFQIYALLTFLVMQSNLQAAETKISIKQNASQAKLDKELIKAGKLGIAQIKEALEKGANINTQNNQGDTPLIIAVDEYELDIVKLLLSQSEIKVDLPAHDGTTPLIHAIRKAITIGTWNGEPFNNTTTIKLLISHGANPNFKDRHDLTAFDIANTRPDKPHILQAMQEGIAEYEKRKAEQELYQQQIVKHLQQHILQDLGNIVVSYNEMTIPKFIAMQKNTEEEQKTSHAAK